MNNLPGVWIEKKEMQSIPATEYSASSHSPENPLVSVLMMTRNHEGFLQEAVESVVQQRCDFPIEIIIGEDFSKDDTLGVARQLVARYPECVHLIFADRNVGITSNFLRLVVRARGKFIALLEGDDYWTDQYKLQQQVALLDSNKRFSWCAAGTENRKTVLEPQPYYTLDDMLRRYPVHTSTVLFRRVDLDRYYRFPDIVCWDSMLFAYLTEKGDCAFFNRSVSYYRRHTGGLWNNAGRMDKVSMSWRCVDAINEYFSGKYREQLADREVWLYEQDISLQPMRNFWKYWTGSLYILTIALPRVIRYVPMRYVVLWMKILVQPVSVPLACFRQQAGLGKRLKNFVYHDR